MSVHRLLQLFVAALNALSEIGLVGPYRFHRQFVLTLKVNELALPPRANQKFIECSGLKIAENGVLLAVSLQKLKARPLWKFALQARFVDDD